MDVVDENACRRWVCFIRFILFCIRAWASWTPGSRLVIVLMLINLPIIVWMLYTYFKEIPGEILEAARMDGATLKEEILYILTPMAIPGIASTLLLNFILAWNEAFWTLNLTAANAGSANGLHCQLFQPRRPVLRKAQRCIDHGHCANPHPWLVQPETTCQRPDLRRRQIRNLTNGTNQT